MTTIPACRPTTTTTRTASACSRTTRSTSLGQADFLRLMTEQLKNQDPLKPLDNAQFLGQLAQFSTVQGIDSMQGAMNSMASVMENDQALRAATLVGHDASGRRRQPRPLTAGSGVHGEIAGDVRGPDEDRDRRRQRRASCATSTWTPRRRATSRSRGTAATIRARSRRPAPIRCAPRRGTGEDALALDVSVASHIDSVSIESTGLVLNLPASAACRCRRSAASADRIFRIQTSATASRHSPQEPTMSFRISLSGMNAATADLNVTSNNIANANTTGFKQARAEFGDVFAASPQGVAQHDRRGRQARRDRAAVRPGQHRLHRPQPGSRDLGPGLLHPLRRRRDGVFARRQLRRRCRRLRRQSRRPAPAGVSSPMRPAPASTPARLGDLQLTTGDSPPRATTHRRPCRATCRPTRRAPTTTPFDADRSEHLQPHHVADGVRLARRGAQPAAVLRQDGQSERVELHTYHRRQRRRRRADAAVLRHRRAHLAIAAARSRLPAYTPGTGANADDTDAGPRRVDAVRRQLQPRPR